MSAHDEGDDVDDVFEVLRRRRHQHAAPSAADRSLHTSSADGAQLDVSTDDTTAQPVGAGDPTATGDNEGGDAPVAFVSRSAREQLARQRHAEEEAESLRRQALTLKANVEEHERIARTVVVVRDEVKERQGRLEAQAAQQRSAAKAAAQMLKAAQGKRPRNGDQGKEELSDDDDGDAGEDAGASNWAAQARIVPKFGVPR